MAKGRSTGRSLILLLLAFGFLLAIVSSSSSSEHQQQQQRSEVSPPAVSAPQKVNIGRGGGDDTKPVDSSEEDSSEDDIPDDDANGEERGDEEEEEDDEEDETSSEPDDDDVGDDEDDNDEFEHELRAVAAEATNTTTDKAIDDATPQRDDDGKAAATTNKEVKEFKRRKKTSFQLNKEKTGKDKRLSALEKEALKRGENVAAAGVVSAKTSENTILAESGGIAALEELQVLAKNERKTKRKYEANRLNGLQSPQDVQWLMRPSQSAQKLLSKRQSNEDVGNPLKLIKDLKEYLLIQYAAEREKLDELSAEELLATENVFQVLAKLSENPERWERIHQLLMDVKADVDQSSEAKRRLVGAFDGEFAEPLIAPTTTTTTTSSQPASEERPTRKARKKKKKKKKLRKQKLLRKFSSSTTTVTSPVEPLLLATTDSPLKWRSNAANVMAKQQQIWSQEDVPGSIAKIRYTVPAPMRGWPEFQRGGSSGDKEQDSLRALNSERQALMLKAAREFDYEAGQREPTLHYGKISTHPKGLFDNDGDDDGSSGRRAYHFGQVVSHGGGGGGYEQRPREQLSLSYPGQRHRQQQERFNANFGQNQGYLPPGRKQHQQQQAGGGGGWIDNAPWRGYDRTWNEDDDPSTSEEEKESKNSWNWRPKSRDEFDPSSSSWLQQPWNVEPRDYYARLEEREEELNRDWRQRQQSWERQNTRENFPARPGDNEMSRLIQRPGVWPNREKSNEYVSTREKSPVEVEENNGRNDAAKSAAPNPGDSKDSPKLTLKTWDSLTSDPATWPFKLPGAKPWPKDKNGVAYNPNAAIVRKLGLITDKQQQQQSKDADSASKDPRKQHNNKSFKNAWDESSNNNNNNNNNNVTKTWQQQQSSEKIGEDWKSAAKWKQFAYHKVTQPGGSLAAGFDNNNNNGSSSGSSTKLSNKNAFIAVSAVAKPRYNGVENDWRKNDIEELETEQNNNNNIHNNAALDVDHPSNQMRMNIRKKNDALENQLEKLKTSGEPVLLEVNVHIQNSTVHRGDASTRTPTPVIGSVDDAVAAADKNASSSKTRETST